MLGSLGQSVVGGEALQMADGHGGLVGLEVDATTFALLLLRTDTATDGRQRGRFAEGGCCLKKMSGLDVLDKAWDVDAHWAALPTSRIGAIQTAAGFLLRHLCGETAVHLAAQQVGTLLSIECRHLHTGLRHALTRWNSASQCLAPSGVAVGAVQVGFSGREHVLRFARSG